jgi:hypothetical protein
VGLRRFEHCDRGRAPQTDTEPHTDPDADTDPNADPNADIDSTERAGIAGLGHSGKGLISITIGFNEALTPGSAGNSAVYTVLGGVKRRKQMVYKQGVGIKGVVYDGNAHAVMINLAKPYKGKVRVTVHGMIDAASGAANRIDFSADVP